MLVPLLILYLRNIIHFQVSNYIYIIIHIQSMQFPVITYGMALYINLRHGIPTKHWHWDNLYASELRKLLLFLSIFCWYFRYFVGTQMTRACRLNTCTDKFPNVPTKPRKSIIGGGGGAIAPLPPSGYANGERPPPPPPGHLGMYHVCAPSLRKSAHFNCARFIKLCPIRGKKNDSRGHYLESAVPNLGPWWVWRAKLTPFKHKGAH